MPDDIYDYFSGNKGREVEPIEDDDDSGEFDSDLGKTEAANDPTGQDSPQDSEDIFAAFSGNVARTCLLYTSPSPRD